MIKRVIDISQQSCLSLTNKQLLVKQEHEVTAKIPVEDVGVLILQHPAIVITQAVIIALQQNNAAVLFCDARHLPYSITLPISDGHSLHSKILQQQIQVSSPTKKRLWQQVVKHKISAQVNTLKRTISIEDKPLLRLAQNVKSGDPENYEAQAARRYWQLLFGKQFRRNTEAEGINSLLNYGYAIVRGIIARAIAGAGLHPAIGIHHRNQYNGLNLADDLMEPFRPWMDKLVYDLAKQGQTEINQKTKKVLLDIPSKSVRWHREEMPLMVASHYLLAEFKRSLFSSDKPKLSYPTSIEEMPALNLDT